MNCQLFLPHAGSAVGRVHVEVGDKTQRHAVSLRLNQRQLDSRRRGNDVLTGGTGLAAS